MVGIVRADAEELETAFARGACDMSSSGRDEQGEGDLVRVLAREDARVVVHGIALKPGKEICMGAVGKSPRRDSLGYQLGDLNFYELRRP